MENKGRKEGKNVGRGRKKDGENGLSRRGKERERESVWRKTGTKKNKEGEHEREQL